VGNLRVGAQLPIAPVSRIALVASVFFAIATTVVALRAPRDVIRDVDLSARARQAS
jgi:hypothetical protein